MKDGAFLEVNADVVGARRRAGEHVTHTESCSMVAGVTE